MGDLGPTKNARERDSVYERQVAIRIRGGTETGCCRHSEQKSQRKERGAEKGKRRRGIEGLTVCVSQWLHPSSRVVFEAPVTVAELGLEQGPTVPTGYSAASQLKE